MSKLLNYIGGEDSNISEIVTPSSNPIPSTSSQLLQTIPTNKQLRTPSYTKKDDSTSS